MEGGGKNKKKKKHDAQVWMCIMGCPQNGQANAVPGCPARVSRFESMCVYTYVAQWQNATSSLANAYSYLKVGDWW